MRKSKQTVARLLHELEQVPNISLACKKIGISRQTLYRWKTEDADLARMIDESYAVGIESISDLAESKLVEKIQAGDFKAMRFWLENNNKRYVRPRKQITHGLIDLKGVHKENKMVIQIMGADVG